MTALQLAARLLARTTVWSIAESMTVLQSLHRRGLSLSRSVVICRIVSKVYRADQFLSLLEICAVEAETGSIEVPR